jgi:hypothetical protein
VAKNWFDGPIPTPEIGILGGLPSLQLTEEDKRRAWAQMLMQGGLATAAASLGGANTGRALGTGLLGGAEAYGQGLQAPAARMDAYAKQLKMQGDQIGNAKGMEELAKLKRDASDYANKNDFLAMLNDPGRAAMLYGGGPSVQNEQRASQFGANPAMLLSDPRMNLKALQAGVDPKQLGAALENTRPFKMDPGAMYQNPVDGSSFVVPNYSEGWQVQNGKKTAVPGQTDFLKGNTSAVEEAKAKYDLTSVPQSDGSNRMMSRLDYLNSQQAEPQVFNVSSDAEAQALAKVLEKTGAPFSVRVAGSSPIQGAPKLGVSQSPTEQAVQTANAMLSPEAQKIATSEGLKASIDRIGKSKDLAKTSIDSALALQQAMDAVKSGAYQGRFADWQTAVAAVMSALPGLNEMIDPAKLAKSQVAAAHLSEQILGKIKTLGANPSNADREYITKTVAQLTNDPAAFTRLTNYMQSMIMRGIENHNADASRIHSVKGLDPSLTGTDYRVNAPAQLVEARQKVMTVFKNGTPEQKKHLRALGYVE